MAQASHQKGSQGQVPPELRSTLGKELLPESTALEKDLPEDHHGHEGQEGAQQEEAKGGLQLSSSGTRSR